MDGIEPSRSVAMRRARIVLIVLGIAVLGIGGVVLLNDVNPARYLGIVAWFAGAIIIHDGIIAPVVFGIGVLMRKRVGSSSPTVVAIVQAALVVAAIMTALVVPEILKQAIGSANSTLLSLDYGQNLIAFYLGVGVAAGAAALGYTLVAARRQKVRPPSSHD